MRYRGKRGLERGLVDPPELGCAPPSPSDVSPHGPLPLSPYYYYYFYYHTALLSYVWPIHSTLSRAGFLIFTFSCPPPFPHSTFFLFGFGQKKRHASRQSVTTAKKDTALITPLTGTRNETTRYRPLCHGWNDAHCN